MPITVRFLSEGQENITDYPDIQAVLHDIGLKILFDNKLVESCVVERAGKRLAGLPFHDMTWGRFEEALEPLKDK